MGFCLLLVSASVTNNSALLVCLYDSDELSTFAKEVNGEASIGSTFLFQLTKFCKRLSNSAVQGAPLPSGPVDTLFPGHARFSPSWLIKKRGVDCDERGEPERRYAPAHAERQRMKVELGFALFVDYLKVRQKRGFNSLILPRPTRVETQ